MVKPDGIEWGVFFDDVHIVSVNFSRQEARLFENGGSGKGKLLFKSDESAAKVSLNDPFALLNLAFHFVVSYELLAQVADEQALKFFEQVGAKEFLERLSAATTDEDRRNRFNGLGPKFTNFDKVSKPAERRGRPPKATTTTEQPVTTP